MLLYIMRHGEAVSFAPTDAERPLTDRGRRQASFMVHSFLPALPTRVIASPYVRAQETAAIVCEGLRIPAFETEAGITPEDDPFSVIRRLQDYEAETLLMVSHQPLVSSLVSLLAEGHLQGGFPMATASVACLQTEVIAIGMAQLNWLRHAR